MSDTCSIQRLNVAFEYPVVFTEDAFAADGPIAELLGAQGGRARVMFVLDGGLALVSDIEERVARFARGCGAIEHAAEPLILPGGEECKNGLFSVRRAIRSIKRNGLCRHSYVIAVGGGALLDAAGLAASLCHRGIRLVRVPSTVLSQSDGGIGVKNGVNLEGSKNYLGAFTPPFAVVNDLSLLATLPDRDWRSGMTEAVKIALVKDGGFFELLEARAADLRARCPRAMRELIERCAGEHLRHIAQAGDPFELGSARPLDFGHWAAHRLEQISGFELRHGEAVGVGIALDSACSHLLGHLGRDELFRIVRLLAALGAPFFDGRLANGAGELLPGLEEFRQHLGGRLTITLLRGIGSGFETNELDAGTVSAAVELLARMRREIINQEADDGTRQARGAD